MKKAILTALAIIAISTTAQASNSKEQLWVLKGQTAVKAVLKDGGSAKFRNTFFNQGKDGVPVSCGEVNSKNSFGGYSGFQRYISAGRVDLTFLEEQMPDFNVAWNRFCL